MCLSHVGHVTCSAQRLLNEETYLDVRGCSKVLGSRGDALCTAAQDLEKRLKEENARREAVRTQLTRLQERRDADAAKLRAACALAETV